MFGLDATLEIFIIGALFSALNYLVNRAFGIQKRMNEIQEQVKAYQKKMQDAAKAKDEKLMQKIVDSESERMNSLMMEMIVMPWKTLIVALPLFMLFTGEPWVTHYPGIILESYPGYAITLPFDLHPASVFALKFLQSATYGPRGFFIVCILVCGMAVSFIDSKRRNAGKN